MIFVAEKKATRYNLTIDVESEGLYCFQAKRQLNITAGNYWSYAIITLHRIGLSC